MRILFLHFTLLLFVFSSCKEETKDTAITVAADCGCAAYYDSLIVLPNAFTPNNDGKNDVFRPFFYKIPDSYTMSIKNLKDNKVVFTADNVADGWDGKWNGTVHQGNYEAVLSYTINGNNYNKTVCVSLVDCILNSKCRFLDQYIDKSGFTEVSLETACP